MQPDSYNFCSKFSFCRLFELTSVFLNSHVVQVVMRSADLQIYIFFFLNK
jgi:hypothetical protein